MVKKKIKKICIATIFLLFAHNVWAYNFESGGLYYNITSDTTAAVTYKDNNYNSYSGNITIPDTVLYNNITYSVTSIGNFAFYFCRGLTSVTIGNSVTSIGNSAFEGCRGLTSITIPDSVTSIGDYAFMDCSGLTSVTIPNSVTSIGDRAFNSCIGLTSVTIGNSVTSIGGCAFACCRGLTSIIIPNSVTSIGYNAFDGCSGLTSVTIGNSVTSIGTEAFEMCIGLTSITIPNSVTSIGTSAFSGCRGLTSVTFLGSNTSLSSEVFGGVPYSIPIYIPCGSLSWYSSQSGLSFFSNIIEQLSYKYTVFSQDTTMGNVASITTSICTDSTWTISATANDGYHFTQWSDGNTQNPRTIQVLSDTILIAYFAKETTGIEEVSQVNNAVHLYPNPAKTMLTIENATENVQIFDIAGRVVMNIDNKETNMLQINISHLSKGMYFVKIGNYTTKFVKE